MIDLRLLREDPERVRASQRARGEDVEIVDVLLDRDERRRAAVARFDSLRAQQKTVGSSIAQAEGAEREELLGQAKELSAQVKAAEEERDRIVAELRELQRSVPNVVEDGAPAGGEDDYAVLEHVGTPPDFGVPPGAEPAEGVAGRPRDHVELGQLLGAIDTERGAKVSGARFYYLTGHGALLEFGLLQLGVRQAVAAGFTPVVPPVLVRPDAMDGTGFLGAHAADVYHIPEDDLYLAGTAEVPLAAYHTDEVLDGASLPLRYAGWSSCFRREAGSYGKDVRGITRVHQFNKVEMFSFCRPEDAYEEHLRFLAWEKEMLAKVELPYRIVDIAAGDLGTSAARKYDCEAWVPSQGRYREVTSTSNCTDFQARRLGVRFRDGDGRTAYAATLNGTLATTRWLVPILENHQLPDGSVRVPEALQPYVGRELLEPVQ